MIFWSIKVTILSLILIFVFHNLYGFFKHTLTTPKIKDLVNKPQKKYDEIINTIQKGKTEEIKETPIASSIPKTDMKDELKHFLSEIKNKPSMTPPFPNGGCNRNQTGNDGFQSSDSFTISTSGNIGSVGNDYASAYTS